MLNSYGEVHSFMITSKWIAIPEWLYFTLFVVSVILVLSAIISIIRGIMRKKPKRHFIIWSVMLLIAVVYPSLSFTNRIVENTMVGGGVSDSEPMHDILVRVEEWKSTGFEGVVADEDAIFNSNDKVFILFKENVTVTQQDRTIFNYNADEPNAKECNIPVNCLVRVGYQTYKKDDENSEIYAYHISPYNSVKFGDTTSDFQMLSIEYTVHDDGTYTCMDTDFKYMLGITGIEGTSEMTYIVLSNNSDITFEEVSYNLKKAEMSKGAPEFVILGWY